MLRVSETTKHLRYTDVTFHVQFDSGISCSGRFVCIYSVALL